MSIRTYFGNIADAIRQKTGTQDTYTPEEMPDAIINIPSGGHSQEIPFFSYLKFLTNYINLFLGDPLVGNTFTVVNKKLSSVYVNARKSINITIQLYNMNTATLLSEIQIEAVTGWNYVEFPYILDNAIEYGIYAHGESDTFTYYNQVYALTQFISDGITYVSGRYGNAYPGTSKNSRIYSVIPQFLEVE